MTAAQAQDMADQPVPLPNVQAELNRQAHALQSPDSAGIYRLCMSNLIVYCDGEELARRIEDEIPDIVAIHPARVILLVALPGDTPAGVTAWARVHPNQSGASRHAGWDQITLRATGRDVDRLPYSVRGLIVGDLPTNLWWATAQPPGLAGPILFDLAERADQIIYDSIGWLEPARGVAGTCTWLPRIEGAGGGRRRVVSDLNWRRLKYWRRLLAQALDPARVPDGLNSITDIRVEHGPHAVVQAWELVSWLAAKLGWRIETGKIQPGVEITWKAESARRGIQLCLRRLESGAPQIQRMRIAWSSAHSKGAINAQVEDERRLSVTPEEEGVAPRTLTVRPAVLSELVGQQLSDREIDPTFRRSMEVAQRLARSLLH